MHKKHHTVIGTVIAVLVVGIVGFIGVNLINNVNAANLSDWQNSNVKILSKQARCGKKYQPVCAYYIPQIDCIQEPCPVADPVVQTYNNKCLMEADGATFLYAGVCQTWTTSSTIQLKEPKAICDAKYKPVCGEYKPQIDCIQEPCPAIDAVRETYTNRCTLDQAGAKFIYNGVCK